MSITTSTGQTVRFLGFSRKIRMGLLKALLGGSDETLTNKGITGGLIVNESTYDEKLKKNVSKVYLGLSKKDPGAESEQYEEPVDENYRRVLLSTNGESDFLEENKYGYKNGKTKEIKFNRSFDAWENEYPYFILITAEEKGQGTLLAWGEMDTPIKVEAKDIVPLFQEEDFKLYWPTPNEAENLADGNDDTDSPE